MSPSLVYLYLAGVPRSDCPLPVSGRPASALKRGRVTATKRINKYKTVAINQMKKIKNDEQGGI
jgi:hypothetical protein